MNKRCLMFTYFCAGALVFSCLAQADSLPTITITGDASGVGIWGWAVNGCEGVCLSIGNSSFGVFFEGFVPEPYFQAYPGALFTPNLGPNSYGSYPDNPTGSVLFNGIAYAADFNNVQITGVPFTMPYGGTTETPAQLIAAGTACTVATTYGLCNAPPWFTPQPVAVANVTVDIPGYLTFYVTPDPDVAPDILYAPSSRPSRSRPRGGLH